MLIYSIHAIIPNETYLIMTVNVMLLFFSPPPQHEVVFKQFGFLTFHVVMNIKSFTVLYKKVSSVVSS